MMRGALHRLTTSALAAAAVAAAPAAQNASPSASPDATQRAASTPAPPAEVPAPDPPAVETGSAAALARREQARSTAEEALRAAAVPKPIDRARFIALLAAIDKDLPASVALLEAHTAYFDGVGRQNESTNRQILRLLPAAYSFEAAREAYEPRATPELVALLGLRDKAARAIDTAERKLLAAVEAAIPADRKPGMAVAILALRSEQLPATARLVSTHASLVDLVTQLRLAEATRSRLDDAIAEYAAQLGPVLAERAQLVRQSATARAVAETAAGTLWRDAPVELARLTTEQLDELDTRDFLNELSIRGIHFDALARLRARLEPKDGRRLVESWQRLLHPELFDDERMIGRIVEDTLAHPSLSDDHDAALLDLIETAYARLEPLSRSACESADLILPRTAHRTPESVDAEIGARLALIATQRKRREIIRECVQRIRGMIGDSDAALTARLDDAMHTLASLDRADAFEERALAARRGSIAESQSDSAAAALPTPASDAKPSGAAPAPSGQSATQTDTAQPPARGGRGSRRGAGQ